MKTLIIENEILNYQIKKQNRKTIAIKIDSKGNVVLSVPLNITKREIEQIILKNKKWIQHQRIKIQTNYKEKLDSYKTGKKMWLLGNEFVLNIEYEAENNLTEIEVINNEIVIKTFNNNNEFIKNALEIWYREKAKIFFLNRTEYMANKMNLKYNKIFIKNQKTRWGSCSSKKNLNFNFRLLMGPTELIDYIIVHELCHLVHLDHSNKFWNLVEKNMPNYKERKILLRKWEPIMNL